MSDTVVCLERRQTINVLQVPDITAIVTTVFITMLLIIIIILIILLVYYCIKKRKVKKSFRVAPTALIAATMGRVSQPLQFMLSFCFCLLSLHQRYEEDCLKFICKKRYCNRACKIMETSHGHGLTNIV